MPRPYTAASLEQLLAIASPGREAIIDAVAVAGPCTVPELARSLGRSRHSLYYHVRALRDCGLLLEKQHAAEGKRPTARYDLPGRPVLVRYDLSTLRARRAVVALGQTRLRAAARDFARACRPDVAVVEGSRRNLWAAHWQGWLSGAELEQANAHLEALVLLLRHDPGPANARRKLYALAFALAPVVPPQPKRRPRR